MQILIGSSNRGKISDYRKYLVHSNLKLVSLMDLSMTDEPLEIGETYEENARLKAEYYAKQTEYPTLADDGGFEVDALDGRPGIESRRWVGPYGTDEDRIQMIMTLLEKVPAPRRTARLTLTVAVYFPAERDYITVEKSISGVVPFEPCKTRVPGLPYRSIFFLPKYEKYFAELTPAEHEEINHRRAACGELVKKLEPRLNS